MESKKTNIRLFEHLYVEISSIPSCSAFGYTNPSEKNISFHQVPSKKAEQGTLYEMDTKYKANWKLTI